MPTFKDQYLKSLSNAIVAYRETLINNQAQKEALIHSVSELEDSKLRYYNLLNLTASAIIAINDKQEIVLFNKAAEKLFGYDQSIIGQNLSILIPERFRESHQQHVEEFDLSDIHMMASDNREPIIGLTKDGKEIYIEASLAKIRLTNQVLMTAAINDVTKRKQQEEKIIHQAHYDYLTGLPNRFLSLDRLSQLISDAKRHKERVAIIFLDLDDFKKINDTLGHDVGDDLLVEAANRLRSVIRSGDTVGRLGGDEFIIMVGGITHVSEAQTIAENLVDRFRDAFEVGERKLMITTSVGIALFPDDADTASELLKNADSAMYHSKNLGRNTYSFFTESMNHQVARRLSIEEQMHDALEKKEFYVVFQPKVDITSGMVVGAECLVRWNNPTIGQVPPDEFIAVAEQMGVINQLGYFVISEALKHLKRWISLSTFKLHVAVNVSPRQFRDLDLYNKIKQMLEQSDIDAESLELEITEGVLISADANTVSMLKDFGKLGIQLAMDDFGTGYSSLSYIRNYPFKVLKIDRTFINNMENSETDKALISATIAMAKALDLKTVAEGVETAEQLHELQLLGCDSAQGYLLSKPVSPEKMEELIKENVVFL